MHSSLPIPSSITGVNSCTDHDHVRSQFRMLCRAQPRHRKGRLKDLRPCAPQTNAKHNHPRIISILHNWSGLDRACEIKGRTHPVGAAAKAKAEVSSKLGLKNVSPNLNQHHLQGLSHSHPSLSLFRVLQAACLSQPTSREVNSLCGHKVSARSQPTRVKSTHFGYSTLGKLEK